MFFFLYLKISERLLRKKITSILVGSSKNNNIIHFTNTGLDQDPSLIRQVAFPLMGIDG